MTLPQAAAVFRRGVSPNLRVMHLARGCWALRRWGRGLLRRTRRRLPTAMVEIARVRRMIGVVSALARAIVLDRTLRVPKRIRPLQAALDAARRNQREGGEA